jgi:hypothetical protein
MAPPCSFQQAPHAHHAVLLPLQALGRRAASSCDLAAADIWALGIALCEMLTGVVPFW